MFQGVFFLTLGMTNQPPKHTFTNSILPIMVMVAIIVLLTKIGLPPLVAIGAPIALMVIYSIIKQNIDNKKAKTFFGSQLSSGNISRIATTSQLNIIKIDDHELFLNQTDLPSGDYTLTLQHERIVLTKPILTEFSNIVVKTTLGQELQIGWHYVDGDPNRIELEFHYAPLPSINS